MSDRRKEPEITRADLAMSGSNDNALIDSQRAAVLFSRDLAATTLLDRRSSL